MSCSSELRELVTFWAAGTLSRDEADAVARHVAGCDECRAAAIEGAALIDGIRELHLTSDEIVATAAGDLTSPHVLVCPRCRDEVALLRDLNADLAQGAILPERHGWRARRVWLPTAVAALAASVGLVAFLVVPRRPLDDQAALRGGTPALVELLPVSRLNDVLTFAWTPVSGATRYRVSVFFEDGRTVWSREVAAPPLGWPDGVARGAERYRWSVEALAGSVLVARSRLADLEVGR